MCPEAVHFHLLHSSRHLCILKLAAVHCLLVICTAWPHSVGKLFGGLVSVKPHRNHKEKRSLCFILIAIILETWAFRLGLVSSQRPVFISNRNFGWNMHAMFLGVEARQTLGRKYSIIRSLPISVGFLLLPSFYNLNLGIQSVNKYFLRVLIWELHGVVKTQKHRSSRIVFGFCLPFWAQCLPRCLVGTAVKFMCQIKEYIQQWIRQK